MNRGFIVTLVTVSLSFTAFLGGDLISQKDFHRSPNSISTGSILDKFNDSDSDSGPQTESSDTLKLLSSRNVLSPVMSVEKNSILYYEKGTGKVFELDFKDLVEKSISDAPLANLTKTIWSPSRKDVVSVFSYPEGNRHKYFNYKTKGSVEFEANIKSLVFSPDGSQVAYFGNQENFWGIFLSTPDGSSSKLLLPSRLESNEVYWPSNESLAFKTDNSYGSDLYSLSKTGEIRKILETKNKLEVKWSKNGSQFLFSQKEGTETNLFYKNLGSESETSLGVSTSASKCDWSIDNKTVVCGVPKPQASGDEVYEINLDGTKKLLSSPTTKIDTAELFLSGLDDYVVILNSLDNKLYVLKK